jgi:Protein of unknown function (DUF2934)
MGNLPTKKDIEKRAYEIYQARGCQGGGELQDWLAAEKELGQEYASAQKRRPEASLASTPRSIPESRPEPRPRAQHSN